jgi:hypothetical protein
MRASPYGNIGIVQDFSDYGAEEEFAKRPVSMGGHHDQVRFSTVGEFNDAPGRIAG